MIRACSEALDSERDQGRKKVVLFALSYNHFIASSL